MGDVLVHLVDSKATLNVILIASNEVGVYEK
ncbi:MAG: hypothetical protein FD169_581 [Bacillota bacterium]|nr:MAG: hypothetical protein FD169_581 [Bacillota bacterium]